MTLKGLKGLLFALLLSPCFLGAQTAPPLPPLPQLPGAGAPPALPDLPAVPEVPQPQASTAAVSSVPPYAFSGSSDIESILEFAIRSATSSVDAAVYGFTLPRVAEALADARRRGLRVRVICNESHFFTPRRSEQLQKLVDAGVDLRTLRGAGSFGIMHNKLGIFDGRLVKAGSFNWAVTANTANSENAVFISEPGTVAGYLKYFEWMWGFSRRPEEGPGSAVKDYGPPPQDPGRALMFNGLLLPSYSFSPGGRTEADVISAVRFARESADVAVFSFYSREIAEALAAAAARGVKVRVLTDRVQASQSDIGKFLRDRGVAFRWSQGFGGKGVMHNKFAVLDRRLLLTGSFNWSDNAQRNNFENMFYTASPEYVGPFVSQFEKLFSAAYEPTDAELSQAAAAKSLRPAEEP